MSVDLGEAALFSTVFENQILFMPPESPFTGDFEIKITVTDILGNEQVYPFTLTLEALADFIDIDPASTSSSSLEDEISAPLIKSNFTWTKKEESSSTDNDD